MKKKIFISLLLLLVLLANVSLASYKTVKMDVVEEPICQIQIGQNSKFEKKVLEKNLSNKEITLQLQVSNEELYKKVTGEIVLVLDDSNSMSERLDSGKTRQQAIYQSAKTLVGNLLQDNTNLEIGIVSFSGSFDKNIEDANIENKLTSNKEELLKTLDKKINEPFTNGHTNLEAGLTLAKTLFTNTISNKSMIILTDGVPNVSLHYDNPIYSDDVINSTKNSLKDLANSNINVISMLTGIANENRSPTGAPNKTFSQIIKDVFGTPDEPTVGKFYYIKDDQIEKTITKDIYNSLLPINNSLKDIKIVDYFPKEIIDNFEFAYVKNADKGIISSEVDKSNNSITWTISELANGQTATVQYKLKLKEEFDNAIINKVLNTNQKVDLTYKDLGNIEQIKNSNISPKLRLTEPPKVLPNAGITTFIIVIVLVVSLLIFSLVRMLNINKYIK